MSSLLPPQPSFQHLLISVIGTSYKHIFAAAQTIFPCKRGGLDSENALFVIISKSRAREEDGEDLLN